MDDCTTAALVAQVEARDHLRAENQQLYRELVATRAEIDALKVECSQQKQLGDKMFVAGYEQAVREIRDHFARPKDPEVVSEIERRWMGKPVAIEVSSP